MKMDLFNKWERWNPTKNPKNNKWNDCYLELESRCNYAEKAKGIKVRSKCKWYEHGEKSTNFFLKLEKHRAFQTSSIHFAIISQHKITDQIEINKQIFSFHRFLSFKTRVPLKNENFKNNFLLNHDVPID